MGCCFSLGLAALLPSSRHKLMSKTALQALQCYVFHVQQALGPVPATTLLQLQHRPCHTKHHGLKPCHSLLLAAYFRHHGQQTKTLQPHTRASAYMTLAYMLTSLYLSQLPGPPKGCRWVEFLSISTMPTTKFVPP